MSPEKSCIEKKRINNHLEVLGGYPQDEMRDGRVMRR